MEMLLQRSDAVRRRAASNNHRIPMPNVMWDVPHHVLVHGCCARWGVPNVKLVEAEAVDAEAVDAEVDPDLNGKNGKNGKKGVFVLVPASGWCCCGDGDRDRDRDRDRATTITATTTPAIRLRRSGHRPPAVRRRRCKQPKRAKQHSGAAKRRRHAKRTGPAKRSPAMRRPSAKDMSLVDDGDDVWQRANDVCTPHANNTRVVYEWMVSPNIILRIEHLTRRMSSMCVRMHIELPPRHRTADVATRVSTATLAILALIKGELP